MIALVVEENVSMDRDRLIGRTEMKLCTHTIPTALRLTLLSTNPKVSGTAVHENGEITWRGADLDGSDVADVVASAARIS